MYKKTNKTDKIQIMDLNPNRLLNLKIPFCLNAISAIMKLNWEIMQMMHKKQGRNQ